MEVQLRGSSWRTGAEGTKKGKKQKNKHEINTVYLKIIKKHKEKLKQANKINNSVVEQKYKWMIKAQTNSK